jgi:acyl-CoA synthetase (AMP-forming)/AMP-acid ligase II
MNIATWLFSSGRIYANRPALRSGNELHATYHQFASRSQTIGRYLAESYGIAEGDRVAVFTPNSVEYLEILYAIWWIGAVVVPINHKLHSQEAAWIISDATAKLAITATGNMFAEPALSDGFAEIGIKSEKLIKIAKKTERLVAPCDRKSGDLAWLFYTSGTTGRPKGVMLSHTNLMMMSLCYALDVDQVEATNHPLYAAPMSHGAGLYNFPFVRVGACHIIPESQGFDPQEIIDLAGSQKELTFFAAPTMVKRLVTHSKSIGFNGAGIRSIIYGGGPMYAADLNDAIDQFGARFIQIYGQGESPMTISFLPRNLVVDETHPNCEQRRKSVGIAHSCIELRILDLNGQPTDTGTHGEVAVRGDTVMTGYWNNPAATAKTLVNGCLLTGDLGFLDEDGFLTLTDRSKDVIISGGTNIYPREVEETLLRHPGVEEVAVVGVSDPEWGENVLAVVVLSGASQICSSTLNDWCKLHIASFKKPKHYEFVTELPKNGYGKVLKTELRKMFP